MVIDAFYFTATMSLSYSVCVRLFGGVSYFERFANYRVKLCALVIPSKLSCGRVVGQTASTCCTQYYEQEEHVWVPVAMSYGLFILE